MEGSQSPNFLTFDDPSSFLAAVSQTLNGLASTMPTHIRVRIMRPLDGQTLTETELNGGIDGPDCPNLARLVEDWRAAFREIPQHHPVAHIAFDMSTSHEIEPRHIVRLIQTLSTTVHLKASPRHVDFSVRGCSDESREMLQRSFPAMRNDPGSS